MEEKKYTSLIRLRMSAKDAHYGGNLVDGAHMVHLFGDVATELLIQCDGDEGLFCAYNNIEFKAPVYAGDFIEAYGEITHIGNTSRKMKFEARKVAVPRPDISDSAADFLAEPIVVAVAEGTCVTPRSASASLTKSFHTSKKQPCPPCGRGCFFAAGGPHKFRVVTARPLCYNTTILYRVKLRRRFYLCAATT